MTWGKQWTNMDELLSKVAFICMRLHRTIWCHGVQSQGLGLFAPITLYLDSPPAVMNGLCRSSKKSPYKGNKRVYANTRTPTRCLSPTKSLAKNRIFFFLFTSPRCFERLLVSIFIVVDFIEYSLFTYMYITRPFDLDSFVFAGSYFSWIVHTRGRDVRIVKSACNDQLSKC